MGKGSHSRVPVLLVRSTGSVCMYYVLSMQARCEAAVSHFFPELLYSQYEVVYADMEQGGPHGLVVDCPLVLLRRLYGVSRC